ncbi:MAG: hypothetical protein KAQ64_03080 [Candidatus Pacebacteria bacterium]|nr:hypothetical protein [Candidatus Paceibacterota bacterium]
MTKKKGKKKKKPEKNDKCPRCHGTGEMTAVEKLKNGGTSKETVRCNLCYGSGKRK